MRYSYWWDKRKEEYFYKILTMEEKKCSCERLVNFLRKYSVLFILRDNFPPKLGENAPDKWVERALLRHRSEIKMQYIVLVYSSESTVSVSARIVSRRREQIYRRRFGNLSTEFIKSTTACALIFQILSGYLFIIYREQ